MTSTWTSNTCEVSTESAMALRLGSLLAPRARRCASTLAADGSYAVAVDNPYSGETYCEVGYKTSAEALAAVDAGAAAQRAWAAETTVAQRVAVCAKFMEAIKADADRIANDISGMMGKPVAHARGEIGGMMERCEMMMALAPKALAPELLPAKDNFVRTIEKDPVGVVLCIAPWNYPLLTTVNCVVPAVLAGNAVRRRRGVGVREFALVDRPADLAPERLAQRLRGRAVPRGLLLDGVLHGPGQGVLLLLLDAPRAARARVALEPRRRLVFEEVAELRPRVRAHRLARVHLSRGVRHDRGHAVRHGAAKQGQHLQSLLGLQ